MKELVQNNADSFTNTIWRKIAIGTWIGMVVLNVTYFRVRDPLSTGPAIDWLILLRLIFAGAGIGFGIVMLINRRMAIGAGGWLSLAFLGVAAMSASFSQFAKISFGYWGVLAGMILITIGLVVESPATKKIRELETIFLVTIIFCVLKDAGTALAFPAIQTEYLPNAYVSRLGMGVTHANVLGLSAALCFWGFFGSNIGQNKALGLLLGFCLIAITFLTRSRVAIICLFFMGITRYWLLFGFSRHKGYLLRYLIPCCIICCVLIGILLSSFEAPPVPSLLDLFNRGESSEVTSTLTGRTAIWSAAITSIMENPYKIIVGQGYGISEFIVSSLDKKVGFAAMHTHNTFLELLITMGIAGVLIYFCMLLYGARWLAIFFYSIKAPERRLSLNAFCLLFAVLLSGLTEVYIAKKVNIFVFAFFFYLIALDPVLFLIRQKNVR